MKNKQDMVLWVFGIGGLFLFQILSMVMFTTYFYPYLHPGVNPPWYFIIESWTNGLCMIGYFVMCLLLGLMAERRGNTKGRVLVVFSFIWASSAICNFILILCKTSQIFDEQHRTSQWATFAQYSSDPLRWLWLAVVTVVLIIALMMKKGKVKGY